MEWLEITQYNKKKEMTISKLLETKWLARHPWLTETIYYEG